VIAGVAALVKTYVTERFPYPYVLVSANKPASQARPSGPWRRHGPPGCAHLSSGVLASRGWRGTVFHPRRRVRKPEQRPRGHQRSRLPAHPEAGSRAFPPDPRSPWPGRRFDRGPREVMRQPRSAGSWRAGVGETRAGPTVWGAEDASRGAYRGGGRSSGTARMGPREPEDIPGNSATLAPPPRAVRSRKAGNGGRGPTGEAPPRRLGRHPP